jgi:arabinofuranosyltransferase
MSKRTRPNTTSRKAPSSSNPKVIAYVLLTGIIIYFLYLSLGIKFIQDDAYISFRYVENFVNGNGLVFNEGERVEGFTNLFWVLLLSLPVAMKMNIADAAQFLSVIFGMIVLFMTFRLSGLIEIEDETVRSKKSKALFTGGRFNCYFDLIPVFMLALTGAFQFWTVSGMETTMFISFALLGLYFYIKDRNVDTLSYKFPLFLFLASLTRPEGMYLFGLILIHRFVYLLKDAGMSGLKVFFSRNNIYSYLIYIVPALLLMLFRLWYYGYPFPNTFYAKTGFSFEYFNSGIDYFVKFIGTYMIYGLIIILPLYLFKKKENFFTVSLFYFLIVTYSLYVILVGGDVLKQHRFFLPVLPLIYILFAKFLNDLYINLRKKYFTGSPAAAFLLVIIIAGGISYYNYSSEKEALDKDVQSEIGLVEKMKITGQWFRQKQQEAGRPITIAATTIGAVSYFSGVTVIDLLGLTDEEIAHNPQRIPEISIRDIGWKERNYNAGYVMSRNPDFIYFSTGVKPSAYGERALFVTPEFVNNYFPYYFSHKGYNFTDVVYKRKKDEEIVDREFPGNPDYKKTYVNMYNQAMNTSRDKSRAQTAISEFRTAAETGPAAFSAAYQNIADIYMQTGNKDSAFAYYLKAVERNDYDVMSHYGLYQLYSETGDSAKAADHLMKMRQIDPELF